jgi:methylglutaconyl-CoA hydratase
MTESLRVEIDRGIARVTLARPEVRNAFDEELIARLAATFGALDGDASVRVVVLAADGTAFCAGADLNWMKRMAGFTREENEADGARLAAMLDAIWRCSKPVVARVQGDAYGGGVGLVAAADIAIASTDCRFALTETRVGLIPATIAPYVIASIGANAARRYFLTAERFDAHEAVRIGLVHATCATEALDAEVDRIVEALLSGSPHAVGEAKRLVRDVAGQPITPALRADTAGRIAAIRASDEGREGVTAFLEKRKPSWLTR